MLTPAPPFLKTGKFRDGVAFKRSDLDKWVVAGGCNAVLLERPPGRPPDRDGDYIVSDVADAYDKATDLVEKANAAYKQVVESFRSTIKNDMASIAASADRTQKECAKMNVAYKTTLDTLLSQDMQKAIENAERLAAALEKIAEVKGHKLTFAVLDSTPNGR